MLNQSPAMLSFASHLLLLADAAPLELLQARREATIQKIRQLSGAGVPAYWHTRSPEEVTAQAVLDDASIEKFKQSPIGRRLSIRLQVLDALIAARESLAVNEQIESAA